MSVRIAMAWSPECEKELIANGFRKIEVYANFESVGGITSDEQKESGDHAFFNMKHSPYQFFTSSWWGASPD